MDEPKKSGNKPVSSGKKKISEPENSEPEVQEGSSDSEPRETAPTGKDENPDAPDLSAGDSGKADPDREREAADEPVEHENPEDSDTGLDSEEESPGVIKDSPEPYHDPGDPDGIYSDYNEYAADDEYAPVADRMPERPDEPHYQDPPGSEDRAKEESAGEGAAKKSDSEPKKTAPEKKKDEPEEDDDDFLDERERELGGRMSFLDHLDELRKRIFHALISIIITFVAAWVFREQIFRFLSAPIMDVVDQLVVLRPTEPFTVYLKVSFAAAIFFAIPYIMFQVWLFIAPGLYRKEKVYALPFLFSSSLLFILGGLFAYYIILPPALNFLLNTFGGEFKAVISAVEYYDFELIIIVGMGAIFQLPVLVAFLSMFGLVSPGFLWRNFRYAFLLIVIIAAVVSPTTDPMNLFLWSGPMVILYTFSIGISWVFKRRRDKKQKDEDERWSK